MTLLSREFVERHTSSVQNVSPDWDVSTGHFYYYQLNMRNCQIRYLRYEFTWGSEQQPVPKAAPITQQPSRILLLDVSLNDLTALPHDGLSHFKQLRVLDASLNRIDSIAGVEVLPHLYMANFSHNKIRNMMGLQYCRRLVDLNLSMNELEDITRLPCLTSLRVLHLSNNRLRSLQGVQVLSALQELYVQRNQLTDLVPLASCLRLTVLNAADNAITSLTTTVHVLKGFTRLNSVCLYGNPIDRDGLYQGQLTAELPLTSLDNVNLQPHQPLSMVERFPPIPAVSSYSSSHHITHLRDVARAAFTDHLRAVKAKMEDSARFLQSRINVLQEEYTEYEHRMYEDLEVCLSYINHLPHDQSHLINYDYIRHHLTSTGRRPWLQADFRRPRTEDRYPSLYLTGSLRPRTQDRQPPLYLTGSLRPRTEDRHPPLYLTGPPRPRTEDRHLSPYLTGPQRPHDEHTLPPLPRKRDNYGNIKETDEILRCAYNELIKERAALGLEHDL